MSEFKGFPREFLPFFDGLEKNNSKAWFDRHRRDYEQYVMMPAADFVTALGKKLTKIAPTIRAIPKVNQSLFRLNRDVRFSPDKRPYKTNLGILFWEGHRKRMECTGFYFHVEGRRLMTAAGMHMFPKNFVESYRGAVVDKVLGPRLARAADTVTAKGYTLGGAHYKRVPRGYDPDHKNSGYLLHSGLYAMREEPLPDAFFSADLVDHAFNHYRNMAPVHKWLLEVQNR
jgi:uncharacterized protein (TIGR02453 family)